MTARSQGLRCKSMSFALVYKVLAIENMKVPFSDATSTVFRKVKR